MRHFCVVFGSVEESGSWRGSLRVGAWKFENWHLYRLVQTRAAANAAIRFRKWERVL